MGTMLLIMNNNVVIIYSVNFSNNFYLEVACTKFNEEG